VTSRIFPDRPIVSVGAVILDAERVVLVKRGRPPLQGQWSLPGGVVELGETLEEALVREVLEETGLAVEVGPVVEVLDRVQRAADGRIEYHYVIIDYLCRPHGNTLICGSDADDVKWAAVGDVVQHQVTRQVREVVDKAIALASLDQSTNARILKS
jgi:8-oxo-dGTP diphosphatase